MSSFMKLMQQHQEHLVMDLCIAQTAPIARLPVIPRCSHQTHHHLDSYRVWEEAQKAQIEKASVCHRYKRSNLITGC